MTISPKKFYNGPKLFFHLLSDLLLVSTYLLKRSLFKKVESYQSVEYRLRLRVAYSLCMPCVCPEYALSMPCLGLAYALHVPCRCPAYALPMPCICPASTLPCFDSRIVENLLAICEYALRNPF